MANTFKLKKIELNTSGIKSFLKGPEVAELVKGQADSIAGKAGYGYSTDTKQMSGRVIASAYTSSEEAMQDNLENNTLLRCLR